MNSQSARSSHARSLGDKKVLGIAIVFLLVCALTALASDRFLTLHNIANLLRRSALFGVLSLGAAWVIVTGGIDLSIGSVVCLSGCLLPWLVVDQAMSTPIAVLLVLTIAAGIGLAHGLLVARLGLQPFLVTLCGLLLYRGAARVIVDDQTVGFGIGHMTLRGIATSSFDVLGLAVPAPFFLLIGLSFVTFVLWQRTVFGRWLFALGRNETAARFSGVPTKRLVASSYVICAMLAAVGGMLFVLDVNGAQPTDFGNFFELYAIAGAVLGGCALRGGEGSVLGLLIGAALMQVLRNAIRLVDALPNQAEYAILGLVILGGVLIDEAVRRIAKRRTAR
ncbi:MAG: ABC transporter permease [Planctomycetes bacterium]|nr:ABC transporter permease [Planctomycetota bacterium]MCB9917952.1 ABC transporter permease [Planctomycetota bacterium]